MTRTTPLRIVAGLAGAAFAAFAALALAQPTGDSPITPPPNGPRHVESTWHALTNATVHVAPGHTLEGRTVIIRDGTIVAVNGEIPPGARIWDCTDLHIYPGLIDAYVEVDAPAPDSGSPGLHWNTKVTPQRSALDGDGVDKAAAESLRKMGFTAAGISPKGGIFRGSTAVVSLAAPADELSAERPPVYADDIFQVVAFDRGGSSGAGNDGYPNSQMGAIALIRQTLIDADWQQAARAAGETIAANSIDALGSDVTKPLLFDVGNELEALRAAKIAAEFGREVVIIGSGLEFRRLEAIVDSALPMIIPLNFPKDPDVSSVGKAEGVDLRTLMTWEQAPTNPRRLVAADVRMILTSSKISKGNGKFMDNLRKAIEHGLDESKALSMLTTYPASTLGVGDRLGTVEAGKIANMVVTDGPLFAKKTKIRDVWVDGKRHEINAAPGPDLDGEWAVRVGDFEMTLKIKGKKIKTIEGDAEGDARKVVINGNQLSFLVDDDDDGTGTYVMSGILSGERLVGTVLSPDGTAANWIATRVVEDEGEELAEGDAEGEDVAEGEAEGEEETKVAKADEEDKGPDVPEELPGYPFGPYAMKELPEQHAHLFIRGGTIWTSANAGIIENGEIEIRNGKIIYVGPMTNAEPPASATVIDATGKHITAGLIDAHSHTGISRGVNESGQAVTAEVRIGDVTDPDSIFWYRELAGGLTAANSLHGSANPIGGQNQVNKIRWGVARPDDMHFEGAIAGIKFALGENVKQSNWGDSKRTRYPQTRMGVDTLIRDRFTEAREYAARWDAYSMALDETNKSRVAGSGVLPRNLTSAGVPPRRDLELEALAEILAGERLIHCHSYRQDEILMLCRVAGDFGFKIGTFQHVLEGYKVAEAIREHAIGGSCFSDWWAYKVEVQDAIPHNGAIMHDAGVVVSFNSDSNELARRMNLEAAKAVRYGGLSQEVALKFVTINAAIQFKIDDRVGSLESGKDADVAIWSGNPLSTMTICEATYVDGRRYFSLEDDAAHRATIKAERERLIQKILRSDKKDPEKKDKPDKTEEPATPSDPHLAERDDYFIDLINRGIDPESVEGCGNCSSAAEMFHQHN